MWTRLDRIYLDRVRLLPGGARRNENQQRKRYEGTRGPHATTSRQLLNPSESTGGGCVPTMAQRHAWQLNRTDAQCDRGSVNSSYWTGGENKWSLLRNAAVSR
jgi:hypothetical protein